MGLDYGSRRIGLAVSDEEGKFAFPAGAVHRTNKGNDLKAIASFVKEQAIERIVIGLPLHMSGEKGSEARKVLKFADELRKLTELPVDMIDERWSSIEAKRALEAVGAGKKLRKKTGDLDSAAASIILRSWLDQSENKK